MIRCCCTGVNSSDEDDPCPAVVVVVEALLWPADEDVVVDERIFPRLSISPELFALLVRWFWWTGWLPLDCWTITLLAEEVELALLLLLLACRFVEIDPDEMWSIMEQGHVH